MIRMSSLLIGVVLLLFVGVGVALYTSTRLRPTDFGYSDFGYTPPARGGYIDSSWGSADIHAIDSGVTKTIELLPEEKREASQKIFEELTKLPLEALYPLKVFPCYKGPIACRGLHDEDVKPFVDLAMDRFKAVQDEHERIHSRRINYGVLVVSLLSMLITFGMFRLKKRDGGIPSKS